MHTFCTFRPNVPVAEHDNETQMPTRLLKLNVKLKVGGAINSSGSINGTAITSTGNINAYGNTIYGGGLILSGAMSVWS